MQNRMNSEYDSYMQRESTTYKTFHGTTIELGLLNQKFSENDSEPEYEIMNDC